MRIFVKAKAGAKVPGTEKIDDTHFKVAVKAPATEGRANIAIQEALAEYFDIPVSRVRFVSGFSSRDKVFEIG
ncbi:MAG: DUF167 domain-containing protein [bacterium]|nr:DUF167 domain-containing protein [bacterium]